MGGGDAAAAARWDRSYVEQCSGAQLTGSNDRVEWKGQTRGLTGRVERRVGTWGDRGERGGSGGERGEAGAREKGVVVVGGSGGEREVREKRVVVGGSGERGGS